MKKTKTTFLLFLCVISLCVVNAQPVKSQTHGVVYILNDGTVQSSVNATVPIQQDGEVYTFTGNLVVSALVVQRSHVTIDGAGSILSGEGTNGIDLSFVNNVTIKDVNIAGIFGHGVYISETAYHMITGCTIESNGRGIALYNTAFNNIAGNIIRDNDIGFDFIESSNNVFRSNQLDNNYNIAVYGNEPTHFHNDMDDSNTIGGDKKVYYLTGEDDLVITPDTFPDVGFLALVGCSNVTVYDITLSKNGPGILLASTTGTTIARCDLSYNFVGVLLFASSSNMIGENTIANNDRGIQFSMFSTSNTVFSNDIANNRGGIFLFNSSQNLVTGNNITNNDNYGVGLSSSSYNILRSNYFINNGKQVIDASTGDSTVNPSINTWYVSYPTGGNYWSDYAGVDLKSGSAQNETGSDQFGDTPYTIDVNNEDAYPLMPFGSPPTVIVVSPRNITYSTTSISLSYTVNKATSWVGYSLDGASNITINGNTTLSDLSYGAHSIIVYAEDTDENKVASETIYFTVAQGASSSEAFPTWILTIIVVVVVAVILFFFVRIMRKK